MSAESFQTPYDIIEGQKKKKNYQVICLNYFQIVMSRRLKNIENNLCTQPLDYFQLSNLLPPEEQAILTRTRLFGERYLRSNRLHEFIEKAEFPQFLIQPLGELDVAKYFIGRPYGQEISLIGQGLIVSTLAEFDIGFATFLMLQAPLVGKTIQQLGSTEQQAAYLPDLISLKKIWGWALTEPNIGSNASQLQTTLTSHADTYLLNGRKRWIGNGNRDYLVVYAKEGKEVKGAILDMKKQGVSWLKIKNKIPLRIVENCEISFKDVKIGVEDRLPGAQNYKTGVEKLLKHSRIIVMWITVGGCMGAYKFLMKQLTPQQLQSQLIQERVVKMMSNIQAMLLVCWRISLLGEKNNASVGQIGMFKGWITERARIVASLARSALEEEGLLHSNYIMKILCDVEVLYTYEGTYDINTLVAGYQLMGLRAFR